MFASRLNQENAVYEQQTAAASKSLNQSGNGLAPKTPGGMAQKTPYKKASNNENAAFPGGLGGKTGGLGNGLGGIKRADISVFETPAEQRVRAPLGNKTTNVKAAAFRTPAPLTQGKSAIKPRSPRFQRGKVKVHHVEPDATSEYEVPEPEYIPPPPVPLPNFDEDWIRELADPNYDGESIAHLPWPEFCPRRWIDEESESSDFEEKLRQFNRANAEKQAQNAAKKKPATSSSRLQQTQHDPLTAVARTHLRAKDAAQSLSQPKRATHVFKDGAGTSKPLKQEIPPSKEMSTIKAPTGNTRHTVAKVASNSTLGYGRGRIVSNHRRPFVEQSTINPRRIVTTKIEHDKPIRGARMLDELFSAESLHIADDEADLGSAHDAQSAVDQVREDALEDFQL